MDRQLVIIGMPRWEVTKPFHAVAQMAGWPGTHPRQDDEGISRKDEEVMVHHCVRK